MSIKNLTEHGQFTKEQLIEEARQAVIGCKNILRVSPNSDAHHISLRLAEITLEALTAPPAPVVPDEMPREYKNGWPLGYSDYANGWNDCRDAMLDGGAL
ncbi:hypothetical protein [Pseudescherichia sp.]|uniref:hypothetical protein n=1 Tax=Pseudescherichia sp. TaxID=2055881 RepID=UPI0028A8A032|nr:hypothetical protein [Pseudescherichia sp.]